MLFRACTQRLCRPRDQALKQFQRSKILQSTSFIPLSRWPESLRVAMSLLSEHGAVNKSSAEVHQVNGTHGQQPDGVKAQAGDTTTGPEKVFAGLDLLGHIKHTSASWSEATPHVFAHMGNRVWIIRDHAARIYAANIEFYESYTAIEELICDLQKCVDNERHGRLLTISYVVRGIQSLPESERLHHLDSISIDICGTLQHIVMDSSSSPAVRSKAVEILNALLYLRIGLASTVETPDVPVHERLKTGLHPTEKLSIMVSFLFGYTIITNGFSRILSRQGCTNPLPFTVAWHQS